MENTKEMTEEMTKQVSILKGLAKHFEIDLTIKLFGISIIRFHWPPEAQSVNRKN